MIYDRWNLGHRKDNLDLALQAMSGVDIAKAALTTLIERLDQQLDVRRRQDLQRQQIDLVEIEVQRGELSEHLDHLLALEGELSKTLQTL